MSTCTAMVMFDPITHPLSLISDLFYPFGFPPEFADFTSDNYDPSEDRQIDHIRTLQSGKALVQFQSAITCGVFIGFHNAENVYPDLSVKAATDAQMQSILDDERKRKIRGEGEVASTCRLETIMWYANWRAKHAELDHDAIVDFSRATGEMLVKVLKLPPTAAKEDVRRFFSAFNMNEIEMEKGAAYVSVRSKVDAERAVEQLNGVKLLNRAVRVQNLGTSL